MLKLVRAVNRVLSVHTPLFVIGAAILAFFLPELFSWVKGNVSSAVLGVIMLSMGVTLTADDLKRLLKRPAD
ncbi:MAG: bile acid:sodium symporter family protein, partial [Fibrobacterales bacterium]|nr:bile acid:sodium symporter family protein [Fibrobacterales bacterium]